MHVKNVCLQLSVKGIHMPVFQPLDSGEREIGGEPSCSCVIQIRLKKQIRGQEADNFFTYIQLEWILPLKPQKTWSSRPPATQLVK